MNMRIYSDDLEVIEEAIWEQSLAKQVGNERKRNKAFADPDKRRANDRKAERRAKFVQQGR